MNSVHTSSKTADVNLISLRTEPSRPLPVKLKDLIVEAGFISRISKGDLVAVKLHFGERGGTAFIRPVMVRAALELIMEQGAIPFLIDTCSLYVGTRGDAVRYLATALYNGFGLGEPIVIADGLRGQNCIPVTVNGRHCNQVMIASDIREADAILFLSHFKGHELTGFGGALKNMGMGCACKAGKLEMHSSVRPHVREERCVACGRCSLSCPSDAITVKEVASIDAEVCVGCARCIVVCPEKAIGIAWDASSRTVQEKMMEYAKGAIAGKDDKVGYVNFVIDVSPVCDCYPCSDRAIVPDLGIAASMDPVALDQVSCDMVNNAPGVRETALTSAYQPGEDKFHALHPKIDWQIQLDYAQEIGLGTRSYRLVEIE
jgi:uncharacterized Fe-S center protein